MGLDRSAAAMMVAATDDRGPSGVEDAEFMATVFTEHGAKEVFSTSDPEEGEAFVAARRFAIPAVEAKGSLLLEDVGVPLPALADLVSGVAKIAGEPRRDDLGDRACRRRQHPPADRLRPHRCRDGRARRRRRSAKSWIWPSAWAAPSPANTASAGSRRPWLAGQLGPEAMELNRRIKTRARPRRHPQPRRSHLMLCAFGSTDRSSPHTNRSIWRMLLTPRWRPVVPIRHDSYSVSRARRPGSSSPPPTPGPNPWPMYTALRDHDPVHHVVPEDKPDHDYYVMSRHADIWAAARDHETFSSAQGLTVNYGELELIGLADNPPMVMQDPPVHTEFRKLVSRGFTPRQVEAVEPKVREFVVERIERIARQRRRRHRHRTVQAAAVDGRRALPRGARRGPQQVRRLDRGDRRGQHRRGRHRRRAGDARRRAGRDDGATSPR